MKAATDTVSAAPNQRGVLVLAYWYPPENESGALRPFRFCKYLARNGWRPQVLSAPLIARADSAPGVHRTPEDFLLRRSHPWLALLGRSLQRVAPYNDRLDWIAPALQLGSRVIADSNISAVISTSPPVATHAAARLLMRRHRVPWIADFRDPLVGNPFRTRWLGHHYDRFIERQIVECADAVILNTDAALDALASRYPKHRGKLHVIWNGYDPEDSLSAAPIPVCRSRTLAHFGTLYGGRHPGILLESLRRLIHAGRVEPGSIRLRLVGSIERGQAWLESPTCEFLAACGSLEYNDAVIPRDQAQTEMAQSNYLLLLDLNELASGVQVPAKLFEYVRIGRPILALTNRGSPVDRILAQSGVPHASLYMGEAHEEIDQKVHGFLSLSTEPVPPSAWFREQFDSSLQVRQLATLLDRVIEVAGSRRRAPKDQRMTDRSSAVDLARPQGDGSPQDLP